MRRKERSRKMNRKMKTKKIMKMRISNRKMKRTTQPNKIRKKTTKISQTMTKMITTSLMISRRRNSKRRTRTNWMTLLVKSSQPLI